ncbi:MAG TPA: hypothetical protein GXX30_11190 [Firmicutes bacterium]|nr:hypothetical protein [Candidatus Fermentithermobacillaceae bacterium]
MFAEGMTFDFFLVLFLTLAVICALRISKKNPRAIRRIPGLDAIEEGVGRATEMNKPVLYLPGFGAFEDPQTLASMAVLSEVSKIAARYDTRLTVAVQLAYLHPMMQEIVKLGYVSQGKGDSFKPEEVRWFSDHYFGYAIAVIGLMFREKVATTIMIGNFAFDALMYAEAGNQVGAIQIGGTANTTQIPFFVAACDYALIGEEIFAAAAYLTKDPIRVATIVAEDWGKFAVAGLVIIGAILKTFNAVEVLNRLLNI